MERADVPGPGPGQAACVPMPAQLGDPADITCRPAGLSWEDGRSWLMACCLGLGGQKASHLRSVVVGTSLAHQSSQAVEVRMPHGFLRARDAEGQLSGWTWCPFHGPCLCPGSAVVSSLGVWTQLAGRVCLCLGHAVPETVTQHGRVSA